MTLPQQQYKEQERIDILASDCLSAWVEGNFSAVTSLVESRHYIGQRIVEEAQELKIPENELVKRVSLGMNKNSRSIYYAVQLYKKFPLLEKAPFTKNETYRDIVHKYLPEIKKEKSKVEKCKKCLIHCLNG